MLTSIIYSVTYVIGIGALSFLTISEIEVVFGASTNILLTLDLEHTAILHTILKFMKNYFTFQSKFLGCQLGKLQGGYLIIDQSVFRS